jgi:hydroxymethylbilane synthase
VPFASRPFRIGTRTSPLARYQADMVANALREFWPTLDIEIVPIKSLADWKKQDGEASLSEQAGGKGQFAKEIEQAHLAGRIDCGVHSAKDMPAFLPDGLHIAHYLPREDARDVLITKNGVLLDDLPAGSVVGTCSPRRKALSLHQRPDIEVVNFRGNLQTRLEKLQNGQVDATFLALAGLKRLGLFDTSIMQALDPASFPPAAGQGAVCMETLIEDTETQALLAPISCPLTHMCVTLERTALGILDGSCHTPIGAHVSLLNDKKNVMFHLWVANVNGEQVFEEKYEFDTLELSGLMPQIVQKVTAFKNKLPPHFLQ